MDPFSWISVIIWSGYVIRVCTINLTSALFDVMEFIYWLVWFYIVW